MEEDDHLFEVDGVKRCSTCREVKPLDEFNLLRRAKDGRQYNCRDCNKAYHYEHWDRHMSQIRRRKGIRLAENKRLIIEYLLDHPCVDCGETDIVVLEFDHTGAKRRNVSMLVLGGWEWVRVLEEIERCEVVCANCHQRRTSRRANTYRHRFVHGDGDGE